MLSRHILRLGHDLGNIQCVWGVQSLSRSLTSLHEACLNPSPAGTDLNAAAPGQQSPWGSSAVCAASSTSSVGCSIHSRTLHHPQCDAASSQRQEQVQQQWEHKHPTAPVTPPQTQQCSQSPWRGQPHSQHLPFQLQQQQPPRWQQQWRGMASSGLGDEAADEDAPRWRVHPSGRPRQYRQQAAAAQTAASTQHRHAAAAGQVAPDPDWAILDQPQQHQHWQQHQVVPLEQQQPPLPPPPPQQQQPEAAEQCFPAEAVHLGAEVDVHAFYQQHRSDFEDAWANPPHKDQYIFELKNSSEDQDMLRVNEAQPIQRFLIVYRYGSVIFLNLSEAEQRNCLDMLHPFITRTQGQAKGAPADQYGALRTDKTSIVVRPTLQGWSKLEPDQIVVQTLELASMRVISHVLAQSVALDYFNWRVDTAIQQFTPYLEAVAKTGAEKDVKEAGLLQLIAVNSLLYTDVVTKIGLLDISPTAWKNDKHFRLWEDLRVDYEIERRFNAIDRKLGPMLENAKFLLDVRAEQKSSGAEWIIIFLICLEVVINLAGHAASFV